MDKIQRSVSVGRIEWIDIAKGMAILFVIIGHTVPFGSIERNFIFSFHMPLFFLLSGYTMKFADSWNDVKIKACKRVYSLLFPVIGIIAVSVLLSYSQASYRDFTILLKIIQNMLVAVFWGSGVPFGNHPGLGMCWFLISLFWADVIMNGLHLIFKNKKYMEIGAICILAGIGIALGKHGKWLPQNFDVTLCCVFFLYLGHVFKIYNTVLLKYNKFILFTGGIFWGGLPFLWNLYRAGIKTLSIWHGRGNGSYLC